MSRYADVILPLPLYGTYTYSVPDTMVPGTSVGCRVLVQFGAKKFYTGIVAAVHDTPPQGYDVKPITALFEPTPILRHPQLRLWHWIADYYLCSPGEVLKAALPSALKVESDTCVSLRPEWQDAAETLTDTEARVTTILQNRGQMRAAELGDLLGVKTIAPALNRMMAKGLVAVAEKTASRYAPRRVTLVELNAGRGDTDALHNFLSMCSRSPRQESLLLAYLDMSGWLNASAVLKPVQKSELLARAGVSAAVFKGLADKGVLTVNKLNVNRFSPLPGETPSNTEISLHKLSTPQDAARRSISEAWKEYDTVLLHGVTGSGKTEIYSHLIASALRQGSQVLYLVPEISLTTQLADRLREAFGPRLVVYHSKFSDSERADIWQRILSSHEPCVILGVRSSVFLPFARLGLVIVDEEHEASYKQYNPAPRYNARDVASVLARMHGAKVLLGSATPSVETYYKATTGKYGLVTLPTRYEGVEMPAVSIVDMRSQRKKHLVSHGIFSEPLVEALRGALSSGRQSILFQNRRGFAPLVRCAECGWTPRCPDCDVSPVYHKLSDRLTCHYCGATQPLPRLCPACGSPKVETYGFGTERIEEAAASLLPSARMERMDLDTTRNKDSYSEIINRFSARATDILVGTQMVSKGLDFAGVSTVGVVNADTMLNFPDFRASERAFNMLEQVAGRAGRRDGAGHVIVQTTQPDSHVLQCVARHDYDAFYRRELAERFQYNYPPFTRVIDIFLRHRDEGALEVLTAAYAAALRDVFGSRVLGPETPVVSRIARLFQRRIMLKIEAGASMPKVKALLRKVYESALTDRRFASLRIDFDVDPV